MKTRFILFRRAGIFYCEDTVTRKQSSLRTRDEAEAVTLLNAKNESFRQPVLNLQIARAYLTASDPLFLQRTWQTVMDQIQTHGKKPTQVRYVRGMKSHAFDRIRHKKLLETTAEDFFAVLEIKQMSVGHYLRRLHNLALTLGWLPVPILTPKLWPKPQPGAKRGITSDEHQRILAAEKNAERNLYYQLLWEVGASQSDAAAFTAENIDWATRTISYFRMKTGERAQLTISNRLAAILNHLPTTGPLFPTVYKATANDRAAEFRRRCRLLKIGGVSLHSYRYSWAERAKVVGMPERFAQAALGHNSNRSSRICATARSATSLPPRWTCSPPA
jgi:integrase